MPRQQSAYSYKTLDEIYDLKSRKLPEPKVFNLFGRISRILELNNANNQAFQEIRIFDVTNKEAKVSWKPIDAINMAVGDVIRIHRSYAKIYNGQLEINVPHTNNIVIFPENGGNPIFTSTAPTLDSTEQPFIDALLQLNINTQQDLQQQQPNQQDEPDNSEYTLSSVKKYSTGQTVLCQLVGYKGLNDGNGFVFVWDATKNPILSELKRFEKYDGDNPDSILRIDYELFIHSQTYLHHVRVFERLADHFASLNPGTYIKMEDVRISKKKGTRIIYMKCCESVKAIDRQHRGYDRLLDRLSQIPKPNGIIDNNDVDICPIVWYPNETDVNNQDNGYESVGIQNNCVNKTKDIAIQVGITKKSVGTSVNSSEIEFIDTITRQTGLDEVDSLRRQSKTANTIVKPRPKEVVITSTARMAQITISDASKTKDTNTDTNQRVVSEYEQTRQNPQTRRTIANKEINYTSSHSYRSLQECLTAQGILNEPAQIGESSVNCDNYNANIPTTINLNSNNVLRNLTLNKNNVAALPNQMENIQLRSNRNDVHIDKNGSQSQNTKEPRISDRKTKRRKIRARESEVQTLERLRQKYLSLSEIRELNESSNNSLKTPDEQQFTNTSSTLKKTVVELKKIRHVRNSDSEETPEQLGSHLSSNSDVVTNSDIVVEYSESLQNLSNDNQSEKFVSNNQYLAKADNGSSGYNFTVDESDDMFSLTMTDGHSRLSDNVEETTTSRSNGSENTILTTQSDDGVQTEEQNTIERAASSGSFSEDIISPRQNDNVYLSMLNNAKLSESSEKYLASRNPNFQKTSPKSPSKVVKPSLVPVAGLSTRVQNRNKIFTNSNNKNHTKPKKRKIRIPEARQMLQHYKRRKRNRKLQKSPKSPSNAGIRSLVPVAQQSGKKIVTNSNTSNLSNLPIVDLNNPIAGPSGYNLRSISNSLTSAGLNDRANRKIKRKYESETETYD